MQPGPPGLDQFTATVVADEAGSWSFRVDGWADPWETWRHAIEVKIDAGQTVSELENDLITGARLLERAARRPGQQAHRTTLSTAVAALRDVALPLSERVGPALAEPVIGILTADPLRDLITKGGSHKVWVDRPRALFSSWYEFFPRSTGGWDEHGNPVHGTFITATGELDRIAKMGFDVVYLPPIHPIGEVNRKGPNNTLDPGPDDPGSPWAIGSKEGGHDAVHPALGTLDDFDAFVDRARSLGLEVALDLALQCAPDHPWVTEHPEWFTTQADGTIAYAENPPKKYQDIYPLNFDNDPKGICKEVLRVTRHWMAHGVRIFRVDNPHTKPVAFWEWLLREVRRTDPDVLFLAEAFTRPAMMAGLGAVGFHQSYTYFTWRTAKWELEDYLREVSGRTDHLMRPNFFVNTPDILHAFLQYGGPAAFKIRAVLAATGSPSWGVYAGYELYEHVAVRPGSEEYLDSEKYQIRVRDWPAAEKEGRTLAPYLTRLNEVRRAHPALQQLRHLVIHSSDDENVLVFSKQVAVVSTGSTDGAGSTDGGAGDDLVIVVVNLDPHAARETTIHLDLPALGLEWNDSLAVHDEITGEDWHWGQHNYVRLDPYVEPAHLLTVRRSS
jgi:starch synthase (maltosyl-transferring)